MTRHPHLRRHHRRQACGPELVPRRHVHQPYGAGLPLAASRAQRNTILATTSSPAQSARRSASTPSTTASARQQGRSSHLSRSKRRAGTVPPPRRCTSSSKSKCATRSAGGRAAGKLKKDISFALRRGTIAQVTTALDAGQRAAEDELALNVAGGIAKQSLLTTLVW